MAGLTTPVYRPFARSSVRSYAALQDLVYRGTRVSRILPHFPAQFKPPVVPCVAWFSVGHKDRQGGWFRLFVAGEWTFAPNRTLRRRRSVPIQPGSPSRAVRLAVLTHPTGHLSLVTTPRLLRRYCAIAMLRKRLLWKACPHRRRSDIRMTTSRTTPAVIDTFSTIVRAGNFKKQASRKFFPKCQFARKSYGDNGLYVRAAFCQTLYSRGAATGLVDRLSVNCYT